MTKNPFWVSRNHFQWEKKARNFHKCLWSIFVQAFNDVFWWGEEVPTKKITLYIWCYVPKEIILALRVVPGCERPSTMVRNPTYGVLSQRQYCRELHAQGGGGSQKVTNDDEREGGLTIPPKIDDVIYEQPLTDLFLSAFCFGPIFCCNFKTK